MTLFYSALSVSVPTFAWVLLGLLLNRAGLLPPALIDRVSRLAFNFGLPLLLFVGAAQIDFATLGSSRHLLAGVLATLATLALSWLYSRWRAHPRAQQGIFVQAAFRSNLAIVGIALAIAAYGERGPALAALPVALMTALYNVLAVWVLNTTLGHSASVGAIALGIARNPLILGIAAGVGLSLSGYGAPVQLLALNAGMATFFLPVMLLCIGGAMKLSGLRSAGTITWEAIVWRLCIGPLIGVLLALSMGVRGEQLGILFLLLSSPVAAASFVMVVAARGDGALAANIVVLSTLCSVVTVTAGFYLLSLFGLVGLS
jgi:predicted permease